MGRFKISIELVAGLALSLISAYYWSEIGSDFWGTSKVTADQVPLPFRFTYRLVPFLDFVITAMGMMIFYRGLRKLISSDE